MEENVSPEPNIVPPNPTPVDDGSMPEPVKPPTPAHNPLAFLSAFPHIPPYIYIIVALVGVVVGSFLFTVKSNNQMAVAPTPAPTTPPTPTPIQTLAPFATSSAFTTFETEVNTLPTTIQGAVIQDQTVTPPVLDLSLGF